MSCIALGLFEIHENLEKKYLLANRRFDRVFNNFEKKRRKVNKNILFNLYKSESDTLFSYHIFVVIIVIFFS